MEQFLKATEIVDWTHPRVSSKAKELSTGPKQRRAISSLLVRGHFLVDEGGFEARPPRCERGKI